MKLLGWTLTQWAIAVSWYGAFRQKPETGLAGASRVQRKWQESRIDEPGEMQIVGASPALDYQWATKMMDNVMREVRL